MKGIIQTQTLQMYIAYRWVTNERKTLMGMASSMMIMSSFTGHEKSLKGLMGMKMMLNSIPMGDLDWHVRQCSPPLSSKHQMKGDLMEEWSSSQSQSPLPINPSPRLSRMRESLMKVKTMPVSLSRLVNST